MEKKRKDQFQDDKVKKDQRHDEELHKKDPNREQGMHDDKHKNIEREKK